MFAAPRAFYVRLDRHSDLCFLGCLDATLFVHRKACATETIDDRNLEIFLGGWHNNQGSADKIMIELLYVRWPRLISKHKLGIECGVIECERKRKRHLITRSHRKVICVIDEILKFE